MRTNPRRIGRGEVQSDSYYKAVENNWSNLCVISCTICIAYPIIGNNQEDDEEPTLKILSQSGLPRTLCPVTSGPDPEEEDDDALEKDPSSANLVSVINFDPGPPAAVADAPAPW